MKNTKVLHALVASFLSLTNLIYAQTDTIPNEEVIFGVKIGYVQGLYKVKKSNWAENGLGDTLREVTSKSQGFSLAFQARYTINSRLSIRIQPGVSFDNLDLNFFRQDGNIKVFSQDNVYIDMPLDLIFNLTKGRAKTSAIFGVKYTKNTQARDIQRFSSRGLSLFANNFGLNIGAGIDFDLENFVYRPEIVFYFSPFNTLKSETLYAPFKTISTINRNYIDFTLNIFIKGLFE
jgi:hypothetical protein